MQRFLFSALFACALFSAGCGTAQNATTEAKPAVETRQGPGDRGDREANRSSRLDEEIAELGLSDAQAKTYREIDARYRKQLNDLRSNSDGDRQKMMADGGKFRAAQEREIFEMLDKEQQEKYNAMVEERKTQMRNRQRGGRPGGRG